MAGLTDKNAYLSKSPLVLSYRGARPDAELRDWITEGLVAGVVIFKDNAPSDEILRDAVECLRASAGQREFRVMIDEEGGSVRRLPDNPASMRSLSEYETAAADAVATAYHNVARRLQTLGIDTLLAPVADIRSPEAGWLADRTYSDNPQTVTRMIQRVVDSVQHLGIACCAKHFPGTRVVRQDTHEGQATADFTRDEWERIDALPFRAAIASGCEMIMVGHQQCTAFDSVRPASLSPLVVRVLLRETLGFTGAIVTDDLGMGAIARAYPIEQAVQAALVAGCDYILVCNDRILQRRAVHAIRPRIASTEESES
jgi:beta-N-acetylhexosaminidase